MTEQVAVRMRLTRVGSTKNPIYRIVVVDQRTRRDGRAIETVGRYDPRTEPSSIDIDADKAKAWLAKGAQPSRTVTEGSDEVLKDLLEYLAKSLVDEPGEVRVQTTETDTTVVLELSVAKEDVGKVIGKQGRIARALRTIVKASAVRDGKRAIVEIVD